MIVRAADDVVVGSGAGGAVVAAELADSGRRVVVLEEGARVPPERLDAMRPSEAVRHLFRDGGTTFALGLGDTPMINVTMGRCVGGSSVLTGGVCLRAPDEVLAGWGLPGYAARALEPCFEEVERRIHVEEVPAALRSRSTVLFGEGLARLGHQLRPLSRNTRGCHGCGRCNFGCPHGAKLSVDRAYLPRAVAAGAEVLAEHRVERVLVEQGRVAGVVARDAAGQRVVVRARRVILAAGAVHTPLILRASGLGGREHVGRHLTLHPSFRMMARFDERVEGWKGALQSAFSDAFERQGMLLVSVFTPPGILAATMPGVGAELERRTQAIPHLAMFGGLLHDDGGGAVRRLPGREPLLTYRMSARDRARVPRLVAIMAQTFFAAGAREVFLPILGLRPVDADAFRRLDLDRIPARRFECSSQHPLGTCRMGSDPRSSVVGPDGGVWGVDGLHIADGSVLPSSLGVNPQLTVMAVATKIAWQLREARKLRLVS